MTDQKPLDTLLGLRGIASVWVMFHHLFIYSSLALDLQGSSLMPLFFLLSGYSLTVAYSDDTSRDSSSSSSPSYIRIAGGEGSSSSTVSPILDHTNHESEMITERGNIQDMEENRSMVTTSNDTREILLLTSSPSSNPSSSSWNQFQRNLRFWNNRLVRVYPLYLLTSLCALPYWLYGYGDVSPFNTSAIIVTSITTIFSLNSSLLFLLGGSLSGPGWTVGTLMV